jgi:predicted nucleic acid-binding protein
MSAEFCDTNILAYAFGRATGPKRDRAEALLKPLIDSQTAALSVQVLQELYVTLTRKLQPALAPAAARAIIADLCALRVVEPTRRDVLAAIDASIRWQISFWDALIVTCAQAAGASVLWSEDLSDGQVFDGVTVRNPFR